MGFENDPVCSAGMHIVPQPEEKTGSRRFSLPIIILSKKQAYCIGIETNVTVKEHPCCFNQVEF